MLFMKRAALASEFQQRIELLFRGDHQHIQINRLARKSVKLSHHKPAYAIQTRLFRRPFVQISQEGIPGLGYFLRSWHGEDSRPSCLSTGSSVWLPLDGWCEAICAPFPSWNHGKACLLSQDASAPELPH